MPAFSATDPRRVRAKKPKVKTGCITCRIRRVKCDEGKPQCQRCIKFGIACDGYVNPAKPQGSQLSTANAPATMKRLVKSYTDIIPSPSKPRFDDNEESQYFRIFAEKTAPDLAGFNDSSVWCRLILQACENQKPIRSAVIAIGALDQTLEAAQKIRDNPTSDIETREFVKKGHQYALQQYGKAVKSMREYALRGQVDSRTLLLSCLLAVSFEIFHGNYVVGRRQTTIGLNLITRNANERKLALNANSQPVPDPIEDALVQLFVRLDLQYLSFMEPEVLHSHVSFKPPDAEKYHKMPARFSSLHEARRYWDFSVRPVMTFMNAKTIVEREQTQNSDPLICPFLEKADSIVAPNTEALMTPFTRVPEWEKLSSTIDSDDTTLSDDEQLVSQWARAFQPIYEASQGPRAKPSSLIKAAILQLRYKATVVALSTTATGGEMQYDKLTPIYTEMVDLASVIIKHTQNSRHEAIFTFDNGIVADLFRLAMKCRVPSLRRRAIQLLESKPRREGLWEGVVAARFTKVIAALEEEDMQGDFVTVDKRIQLFGMSFDLTRRVGVLKYVRGPSNPGETKVIQSVVSSW